MNSRFPTGAEALGILLTEINALANRLKVAPRPGLRWGGDAILEMLKRDGPQTVPQIARKRITSRQSVQILVNRAETEKLVEFHANPAHKRSPLVDLTDAGRELLARACDQETELNSLRTQATDSEILSVASLLKKLREAVQGGKSDITGAQIDKSSGPLRMRSKRRPDAAVASNKAIQPEAADSVEPNVTESGLPVNLL